MKNFHPAAAAVPALVAFLLFSGCSPVTRMHSDPEASPTSSLFREYGIHESAPTTVPAGPEGHYKVQVELRTYCHPHRPSMLAEYFFNEPVTSIRQTLPTCDLPEAFSGWDAGKVRIISPGLVLTPYGNGKWELGSTNGRPFDYLVLELYPYEHQGECYYFPPFTLGYFRGPGSKETGYSKDRMYRVRILGGGKKEKANMGVCFGPYTRQDVRQWYQYYTCPCGPAPLRLEDVLSRDP